MIWKPEPTAISSPILCLEWLLKSTRYDGHDFTAVFMIIIILISCCRTTYSKVVFGLKNQGFPPQVDQWSNTVSE